MTSSVICHSSIQFPFRTPLSDNAYMICEIFSHLLEKQSDLFSCCLVSRLWNTCAIPCLWKAPRLKRESTLSKFIGTLMRSQQSLTIYSYGCLIHTLDLSRLSFNCPAAELNFITECCGVLKIIDFSNCQKLRDDALTRISERCYNLRSLKLLNLPYITDESVINIINRCNRLEYFAFGDCIGITDRSLRQLANMSYLTTLEILFGNNIKNETFVLITQGCSRLKNLHVWDCGNLDDSAIIQIAINMNQNLESLILHNPQHITDLSLTHIASRCTNLRHLGLEPYEGVTNNTLIALANNAFKLESIQISLNRASSFSNDGFSLVAQRLIMLSKVTLQYSTPLVTDITLSILSIRLTSLHLYNCNFTDASLIAIAHSRPPINDLCIFDLMKISDHAVILLLYNIVGTLTSLQISNCEGLSERIVTEGIKHCINLRKLCLTTSSDFTIVGLDAIVKNCIELREFYLASTEDIPKEVIAPELMCLRKLEKLRIRNCPSLSQEDIWCICCACTSLQEFFFGRSVNLNEEFVIQFNSNGKGKPLLVLGP
ncbi:4646_t:CDS:2 [Scutellospora calospora]|uniref:4646_t:CDS:1 n=1 Tax=Scutellospora calospora TaxID=85575 RepID=A0ACA9KPH6_9GLOM|nr:4646_t:CDS:2 [Scutellospora calospora]